MSHSHPSSLPFFRLFWGAFFLYGDLSPLTAEFNSRFSVHVGAVLRPLHQTHQPARQLLHHGVVTLGESQQESQEPDDADDHLGGGGREPGLQRVDDSHVPARWEKEKSGLESPDVAAFGAVLGLPCMGVILLTPP